ncbi:hypothetical protein OVY01_22575 [Robbsia sp. Bb-Pol-6]|uniref:Uncharacterized protein n=1 Tax=Robbsia betulipollinis TaxID=2981849 RepID=A0ABT3ZVQ5_9BURK|nr:hypothetical protein [Robbsia betulipollinis]MCY0389928.1 hypothetical protein [Robbsia betulipollinis]
MTNDNEDDAGATVEGKLGDVWEDTLIIAFRDLQWRQWLSDLKEARKHGDEKKVAELDLLGPDDLHKLDGNAESLFGDVLTKREGRYFVLEFKSARSEHKAEHTKTMFNKVSNYLVAAEEPARARLIELSTPCHFGVFGTRIVRGEANRPTLEQNVVGSSTPAILNAPRMGNLAIEAHKYLDWIHVRNRGWLALKPNELVTQPEMRQLYIKALRIIVGMSPSLRAKMEGITDSIYSPKRRDLASLMWGEEHEQAGADAKMYIEYLTLLTEVVGGDLKTPITLLAVVGTTIYYWTTSVANLPHTLNYWNQLSKKVHEQTAAQRVAAQGGHKPSARSTRTFP